MKKICALCIVSLGLIAHVYAHEVRTWTSVSGATIEARFVKVEQGEIVLENAEGARFSIRPNLLSEADQAYAREAAGDQLATPAPEPEQATPAPARRARGPQHEKTPPLDSQSIPGLTLEQPSVARMVGLQYGPGAQDVVYLIADQSTGSSLWDNVFIFNPRLAGPQQLRKLSTRNRRYEREPYLETESITLNGQFGDTRVVHEVTVFSGVTRPDLVWLGVETTYTTGRDSVTVEMRGPINSDARTGPGVIPVIPLVMRVQASLPMSMHSRDNNVFGSIRAGRDFVVIGPRAIFNSVVMEARDETGAVVETPRVTLNELSEFPTPMTRQYNATFNRLTRRESYTIVVRADLGPVIGVVERELNVRAR